MISKLFYSAVLLILQTAILSGQVKVRLLTVYKPDTVTFTVAEGEYKADYFTGRTDLIGKDQSIIIIKHDARLFIKSGNGDSVISDSVLFKGVTGNDSFILSAGSNEQLIRNYSGDLHCKSDLGTLLLINNCDVEDYVAGVVKAEGQYGKYPEYFKTQAVIARTYMYRHLKKHVLDGFNLCDNIHCQAFNGITDDTIIVGATQATWGLVILGADKIPIISAFHSNCGGETVSSENLWLTGQPYLGKVTDTYCTSSRNARWRKSIAVSDWIAYLKTRGLASTPGNLSQLNFSQTTRLNDYRTGTFKVPLMQVREDFGLRSTFFSVRVEGDSVVLSGRGYGHGVGLCQEGAMVMASKGFDFRKIIAFYYKGVSISDVKNNFIAPLH